MTSNKVKKVICTPLRKNQAFLRLDREVGQNLGCGGGLSRNLDMNTEFGHRRPSIQPFSGLRTYLLDNVIFPDLVNVPDYLRTSRVSPDYS